MAMKMVTAQYTGGVYRNQTGDLNGHEPVLKQLDKKIYSK